MIKNQINPQHLYKNILYTFFFSSDIDDVTLLRMRHIYSVENRQLYGFCNTDRCYDCFVSENTI